MPVVKISVGQFGTTPDVAENTNKTVELIAAGAKADADLVVLPESAMYLDPLGQYPDGCHSEALDGPFISTVKGASARHRVHVIAGFTESVDGALPFNTHAYLTPTGLLAGTYRKVQRFDAFVHRESNSVRRGDASALVFAINRVTIGAATCYDLRLPEMGRFLVDHGADVMVLSASWWTGPMKESHWETLLRARAIESTIYVAGVVKADLNGLVEA